MFFNKVLSMKNSSKEENKPDKEMSLLQRAEIETIEANWNRMRVLHLKGSIPYSDRETILHRIHMQDKIRAVFSEAEELGLSPRELFQQDPNFPALENRMPDAGSIEICDGTARPNTGETDSPCCTGQQIDAGLVRIKAAYTAVVASTSSWKGCQDWAIRVAEAVQPVLLPCWQGKYVWRINVWPFGRWTPLDDGDTWIHHAYAVGPCNAKSFDDWLVLDPYSFTGIAWFQSPDIIPFPEWIAKGNVWHATDLSEHDNGSIYKYTLEFYCRFHPIICKLVQELLIREFRRYNSSASEDVLKKMIHDYGLDRC
jgi:hypothetical protein